MRCFLIIAELWREKRACGVPWVSKSTHPRKFGNHVTVHRTNDRLSAPQGNQCSISHFVASLGAQEDWYCTHIAHQCCDQLTAVKTGYPLTSITWPYRGLRCRPIQVEYFLKLSAEKLLVFRWLQARFFLNSREICCVYVTMAQHYEHFDFKLTSDAQIQPVI